MAAILKGRLLSSTVLFGKRAAVPPRLYEVRAPGSPSAPVTDPTPLPGPPPVPVDPSFPTTIDAALQRPDLYLSSAQTGYPIVLDVGSFPRDLTVGDYVWLERADGDPNRTFSVNFVRYPRHAVTLSEAIAGVIDFGIAGLLSGSYDWRWAYQKVGSNSRSAYSSVVFSGPDNIAPVLLALDVPLALSQTTVRLKVDTDTAEGRLYFVTVSADAAPSKAQVKLGQNHLGTAALAAGYVDLALVGTQTQDLGGHSADTPGFAFAMHEDAAGNQSAVTRLGEFRTLAASASTAKLVTTTGASKNQYLAVSGGGLVFGIASGGVGANLWVRSDDPPPVKSHYEITVTALGDAAFLNFGFGDAAQALNGAYPDIGTNAPGAAAYVRTYEDAAEYKHDGVSDSNALGAVVGDVFSVDLDRSAPAAPVITFRRKRGETVTTMATFTLSSQLPTNWRAVMGGTHGAGGSATVNFGATPFAITPLSGHTGW